MGDRRRGYSGLVGKRRARYLGFPANALENLHPRKVRERTPDSNYRAEKSTRRLFPKGSVAFRITV